MGNNSSIIWKLGITVVVLLWAITSMMPFSDTPFEVFIKDRATANQVEFQEVLESAQANVLKGASTAEGKAPTLYIALRDYANANDLDLSKFFADINVKDIKVLSKRNDILLKELYRQSKGALKKGLDLQGGVSFTLEINEDELSGNEYERQGQLDDVLNVMDNRINGMGVTEPTIRMMGSNAIEVQMPGVSLKDNPEAIEELSRPAKLEFKLVHRFQTPSSSKPPVSEIPTGYEVKMLESERGNKITQEPLYVKKRAEATGEILSEAGAMMEDLNRFRVDMEFNSEGSKIFEKITSNILEDDRSTGTKQALAIVLDGKVVSVATIVSVISNRGSITGSFSRREAIEIANALNNPLAVGLKRTSLNEVGPSLAQEARDSSLLAATIGGSAVVLFMILYYMGIGLIALVSVMVNLVILIGVLASFGATLTLPGIAALVLTMGMAVDANILVFERMREELKLGKSLWSALESGYDKAFSTIVDANLTTLITALILYYFGTGAVKGFGITLAVGILTTLFCSLVLSRALIELSVKYGLVKNALKRSLMSGNSKFDFMGLAKKAFIISWCVVLMGICAITYTGKKSLSIDFTGGELLTMTFNKEQKPSIGQILELSGSSFTQIGEIQASYTTDLASESEYLNLQIETGKSDLILKTMQEKFPTSELVLVGTQSIGGSVSDEIIKNAIISVCLALLGIMIYILIRFEIGFAIGAVIASLHDIFMTIGLYVILGIVGVGSGQFSAPMVAAILMVVGYSINDTIVVFDRIREELTLKPSMTLKDVINFSINRTLARTVLTSITTLISALALFIFGTGIIVDFSLVFVLGILTGTFSSIFIASPIFYWWHAGSRKNVEEGEVMPEYDWQEEEIKE